MKVTPTKVIVNRSPDLLAKDTTTLSKAALSELHVHLIAAPFVPGPTTDFTALTEATFTGSTAKDVGNGDQQSFIEPADSRWRVQLKDPAGGWTWICTADPVAPETIYGIVVTDHADAITYGSALLDTGPVVIDSAGQAVVVGDLQLIFATDYLDPGTSP